MKSPPPCVMLGVSEPWVHSVGWCFLLLSTTSFCVIAIHGGWTDSSISSPSLGWKEDVEGCPFPELDRTWRNCYMWLWPLEWVWEGASATPASFLNYGIHLRGVQGEAKDRKPWAGRGPCGHIKSLVITC